MKYEIINNDKEWENFYSYFPAYKPNKYPGKYPCIARKEEQDYGLIGCEYVHYVKYFSENILKMSLLEAYLEGLETANIWTCIC